MTDVLAAGPNPAPIRTPIDPLAQPVVVKPTLDPGQITIDKTPTPVDPLIAKPAPAPASVKTLSPAPPPLAVRPQPAPSVPVTYDAPLTPPRSLSVPGYDGVYTKDQVTAIANFDKAKTVQSYVNYARAVGDSSLDAFNISPTEAQRNPQLAQAKMMADRRLDFRIWLENSGRADMMVPGNEKQIIGEYADGIYAPIPKIGRSGLTGVETNPQAAALAKSLAGESRSPYYKKVPSTAEFNLVQDQEDERRQGQDQLAHLNDAGSPIPPQTTVDANGLPVAGPKRPFEEIVSLPVRRFDGNWSVQKLDEYNQLLTSTSKEAILRRAEITGDQSVNPTFGKPAEDRVAFRQWLASQGLTNLSVTDMKSAVNEYVDIKYGEGAQPVLDRTGKDTGKVRETTAARALRSSLIGEAMSPYNKIKVPDIADIEDAIDGAIRRGDNIYNDQHTAYQQAQAAATPAADKPAAPPEGGIWQAIKDNAVVASGEAGKSVVGVVDFANQALSAAGIDTGLTFGSTYDRFNRGVENLLTDRGKQSLKNIDNAMQDIAFQPVISAVLSGDLDAANDALSKTKFSALFDGRIGSQEAIMIASRLAGSLLVGGLAGKAAKLGAASETAGLVTAGAINTATFTAQQLSGIQQSIDTLPADVLRQSTVGREAQAELASQGFDTVTDDQIRAYAKDHVASLSTTEGLGLLAVNALANAFGPVARGTRAITGVSSKGISRLGQGSIDALGGGGQAIATGELTNTAREQTGQKPIDYSGDVVIATAAGGGLGFLTGGHGETKAPPGSNVPSATEDAATLARTPAQEAGVSQDQALKTQLLAQRNAVGAAQSDLMRARSAIQEAEAALNDPEQVGTDPTPLMRTVQAARAAFEASKAKYDTEYGKLSNIAAQADTQPTLANIDTGVAGDSYADIVSANQLEDTTPTVDYSSPENPSFFDGYEDMAAAFRSGDENVFQSEGAGSPFSTVRAESSFATGRRITQENARSTDFVLVPPTYRALALWTDPGVFNDGDSFRAAMDRVDIEDGEPPVQQLTPTGRDSRSLSDPLLALSAPPDFHVSAAGDVLARQDLANLHNAPVSDDVSIVQGLITDQSQPQGLLPAPDQVSTQPVEEGFTRIARETGRTDFETPRAIKAAAASRTETAAKRALPKSASAATGDPLNAPDANRLDTLIAGAQGEPVPLAIAMTAAKVDIEAIRATATDRLAAAKAKLDSAKFLLSRKNVRETDETGRRQSIDYFERKVLEAQASLRAAKQLKPDVFAKQKLEVAKPREVSPELKARQMAADMQRASEEAAGLRPKLGVKTGRSPKAVGKSEAEAAVKSRTKDEC